LVEYEWWRCGEDDDEPKGLEEEDEFKRWCGDDDDEPRGFEGEEEFNRG
jgi:hypothetical protein